jgi:drug/metabolite transporter (DMT)-like permease
MTSSTTRRGVPAVAAITLGILAVSTASIFIRYAQEEVPSLIIAAYRLGIAAALLGFPALLRYRQQYRSLSRKDSALIGLAGVFLALHFASWITSLEYTSVVNSVVLVTTTPLWVALFSPLFLRESIGWQTAAGLVVALLGGIIIGVGGACELSTSGMDCAGSSQFVTGGSLMGNLLALVGAWMAAGYLMVGRSIRPKLTLVNYVFSVYGTAALVLIGMGLAAGYPFFGYSNQAYLWLILLAVIPQLLGHSIFNWALAYLPASFVAITLLGEPIGSTILAFVWLDEAPTALNLIGAILILTGIVLASQVNRRNQRAVEHLSKTPADTGSNSI